MVDGVLTAPSTIISYLSTYDALDEIISSSPLLSVRFSADFGEAIAFSIFTNS